MHFNIVPDYTAHFNNKVYTLVNKSLYKLEFDSHSELELS